MKKLVYVINDLSGVGKTVFSEVLLKKHALAGLHSALLATTCSDEASDLLSGSNHVSAWDFGDDRDMAALLAAIDKHDSVIVDVGTGDADKLYNFCERLQLWEVIGELDVELTLAIPINGNVENTGSVVNIAEAFSDNADYVIVKGAVHDGEDDWNESYGNKVMSYLSATKVDAPRIDKVLLKTLRSEGYELVEAVTETEDLSGFLSDAIGSWETTFCEAIRGDAEAYLVPQLKSSPVPGGQDGTTERAIAC